MEIRTRILPVNPMQYFTLYEPETLTEQSRIAIIMIHSDGDYTTFPAGTGFAKLGYRSVCGGVSEPNAPLNEKLLVVGSAVAAARKLPGVEKVLLLGHSGGATLMSCYQAVAENGPEIFRNDRLIVKLPKLLPPMMPGMPPMTEEVKLDPADGMLVIDSNWGNGVMTAISVDPAVLDESTGMKLDPALDAYSPANGYSPAGSHYPEEFLNRFWPAQAARVNRIIDRCLERWQAIQEHRGLYADDEPFIVPGAAVMAPNNKLIGTDMRLLSHTEDAYPLIHPDGTVTTEVIRSLRKPRGEGSPTVLYGLGTARCSVKQYLTSTAVRVTDQFRTTETGIEGIDWDSSWCCTPGNIRYVKAPMLVMGLTYGYECIAAELVYRNSGSRDKSIAFVEGATHMLYAGEECYGDTVATLCSYADGWIRNHI